MKQNETHNGQALPQHVLPVSLVEQLHDRALTQETPVSAFFYDPEVAACRAQRLVAALPTWARGYYAVKANTYPPVLRALARHVDGFDVSSLHEGELAREAFASVDKQAKIIASGPGKSEPNLAGLLGLGVSMINVESVLEMRRISRLAESAGKQVRIALRINPAQVTLPNSLQFGGQRTPFGIAEHEVPSALEIASTSPALTVVGFHFHELCNSLDAVGHVDYVDWCLRWSAEMAEAHDVDLKVIDVGGGLGVMFDETDPFDLQLFSRRLHELRPPEGTQVLFEPGRWLVAGCGFYAAEVTDLKTVHGSWFAVLRGGVNHFLRPALGEQHNLAVLPVERWPYNYDRPEVRHAPVTIAGELCTPNDVLARSIMVERMRVGDIVVFTRAGSYGWEVSLQEFLGHPRALRLTINAANEASGEAYDFSEREAEVDVQGLLARSASG
jgi:2-[(L-alanin-3-ylcarbamoyl)methyl]-2-hydroxybutanedioate decarboxylase